MTQSPAYHQYIHIWERQLHRDYQAICHQYRLDVSPAIIRIAHLDRQWATWDPLARLITISYRLIENCDWQEVLYVLKHEIAHQLCIEAFGGAGGHRSMDFKRACLILDLPKRYQQATLTMTGERGPGPESEMADERAVLDKVRKLLALSRSANEHEAANALAKAKLLIDRHQLAEAEEMVQEGVIFQTIRLENRRVTIWQKKIVAILSRYFYVRLVQTAIYDQFRQDQLTVFEIFGRPGTVEVAIHCFHFLSERLATLWRQKATTLPERGVRIRNSYMYGILQGVEEVLRQQAVRPVGQSACVGRFQATADGRPDNQLLAVADAAVAQRVHQRYPRLSSRTSRIALQPEIYQEGIASGRSLSLRPVFSPQHGETLSLPLTPKK